LICDWTGIGRALDGHWTGIGRALDGHWTGIGRALDGHWTGIGRALDRKKFVCIDELKHSRTHAHHADQHIK